MKKTVLVFLFFCATFSLSAQNTIDQNGLQSTVITGINASAQAKRYEVASIIYNSHHWQNSSIITIELYEVYPKSGYEKYNVQIGYNQGTGSTLPKVTHLDSQGIEHNGKVSLGAPVNHTTSQGGYVNKVLPIYVDTRYYAQYKVKISHARPRVTAFTAKGQIIINEIALGTDIANFTGPSLQSSANLWSQNSNDIYYNTGKVGIGTTTPSSSLHVKSNTNQTNSLDDGIGLMKTLGGDYSIQLTSNNGIPHLDLANSSNEDYDIRLGIYYDNKLAILGGNVGIGTNDPGSFRLNVSGNVYHSGKLSIGTTYNGFTANIGGTTYLTTGSVWTTNNFGFANSSSTNTGFFPRSDHSINVKTNNQTALYVKSGGAIGIATTSPGIGNNPAPNLKLQINGDMTVESGHVISLDQNYYNHAYMKFDNSLSNARYKLYGYYGFRFDDNGGTRMVIEQGGNVGIGTTNPGSWKLAVNGPIRAKEVKVETGWSDFVFEKGYDLPTLEEVENHIKEKGHLKDIPSAKEVEENGILLGQMDSKLLQKIEELTLYTIEQEKKIQSLKKKDKIVQLLLKKVEELQKEMMELKAKK